MLAIALAPIYILVLVYVCSRWYKFIELSPFVHKLFLKRLSWLMFLISLFIPTGFLLPLGHAKRFFTVVGNYWFGISLYIIISLGIQELIVFLLKRFITIVPKASYNILFVTIITTLCLSIYGIYNAQDVKLTTYEVNINKECDLDKLNIVMIADTHFGYNVGTKVLEKTVKQINSCKPDVVLIAGDIFDNEYEAIEDPEALIKLFNSIDSKYGIYACLGNHDVEEPIFCGFTFGYSDNIDKVSSKEMLDFLERSHINILYDSYIKLADSVYIYGRPDKERINFNQEERMPASMITKDLDTTKPIIVLDHEPHDYDILADNKVDLDLSGHTHNGQLWPGTLTIKLFWDNAYGIYQKGDFTGITTSGVGLFGPNMRTGCISEVVNIHVNFKK